MIRVSVIYPRSENAKFDLDYYLEKHVPLVKEAYNPYGLLEAQVDQGVSLSSKHPSDNILVCYLLFKDLDSVKQAFKNAGATVMKDVANFTDIEPQVTFGQQM